MGASLVAVLALLAAPSFSGERAASPAERAAAPVPQRVGALFLGEGGGYRHPSGPASDYLENAQKPAGEGSAPSAEPPPAAPRPEPPPPRAAEPAPPALEPGRLAPAQAARFREQAPSPRAALAASNKERAGGEFPPAAAPARNPGPYALWEGLSAPLELPPGRSPAGAPDDIRTSSLRDYETHVLGARLERDAARPAGPRAAPASARAGEVYVAADLKSGPGGEPARDAVADFVGAAALRADPRPLSLRDPGERGRLRGWMPATRLARALGSSELSRLRVNYGPGRAAPEGPLSQVLLGVRLRDGEPASEAFARVVGELESDSGFRWRGTVGYEKVPGGGWALVLAGEVPIRGLSALLAHRDVLKVAPLAASGNAHGSWAGPPAAGPAEDDAEGARAALRRFFVYAVKRAPLLLGLTAALLLLPLGERLGGFLEVFIPYH